MVNREHFYAEVVPSRKQSGCIGGDFNSIIDKGDASHHPEAKLSGSLKRVTKVFDMKDSYSTGPCTLRLRLSRGQGAFRVHD